MCYGTHGKRTVTRFIGDTQNERSRWWHMIEIPDVVFVIGIFVCTGVAFFCGYQIDFGNGCQAEWKMLLKERGRIEMERQKYLGMKSILRTRCYPGAREYFDNEQFGLLTIVAKGQEGDARADTSEHIQRDRRS